jgi:hypothetical protein
VLDLSKVVAAGDSSAIAEILKRELEKLEGSSLLLQQGLTRSSYTDGRDFAVIVLSVQREANGLRAKAGVLYQGLIAGCNCADDPTPQSMIDEYCEVELIIAENGNATIKLLDGSP